MLLLTTYRNHRIYWEPLEGIYCIQAPSGNWTGETETYTQARTDIDGMLR